MSEQPKSLVLITVDCLRADHCGFNGYSRPTTPFLDALAAQSFVVPTAVIAGAPTYYSLPAILASRMPLAWGRDVVGLAPGENSLATTLREAGYATAAFSAANPYLSPRFGYGQGFEVFEDFLGVDAATHSPSQETPVAGSDSAAGRMNRALKQAARVVGLLGLYEDLYFHYRLRVAAPPVDSIDALRKFPSAQVIVDHAISWLTSLEPPTVRRPFFLWLHLMDPHAPYCPAAETFRELTGRDISATRARYLNEFWNRSDLPAARLEPQKKSVVELYDASIRSMDTQVARLVTHLKQSALWDNCMFVLTADHGEEFLDHGRRYHAPVSLYDEVVRVPLLIRVPQSETKLEKSSTNKNMSANPFSHLHLAPTLLNILGVPAPQSFRGTSLWRNLQQGTPWDTPSVTECVYGCTNPFRTQSRIAPRLLSVRNLSHKLVIKVSSGATEEFYDLQADPRETKPLPAATEKHVRKQLLQAAWAHMQQTISNKDATKRLRLRLRDIQVQLQSNFR